MSMLRKGLMVFAALIASLPMVACEERSGTEIFEAVVLDSLPAGVVVLHSQDEPSPLEPYVWLHFSVTPEAYSQIEDAYAWEGGSLAQNDASNKFVGDWWNPESLSNVSSFQAYVEDCRCTKEMWTDDAQQEVYFKVNF